MANQIISEVRIQGNEKPNVQLTYDMLQGMIEALDEMDETTNFAHARLTTTQQDPASPICSALKGWTQREQVRRPEQCTLPLCHFTDYAEDSTGSLVNHPEFGKPITIDNRYQSYFKNGKIITVTSGIIYNTTINLENEYSIPEHRAIMIPQSDKEGSEAVIEHLGECRKTEIYTVNGVKHIKGAIGLTNLEKIIYYEAGQTAQGDAVLPHEDHSRRAWYKDASQIRTKFSCTVEQAETLKLAFKILDTTPAMAKKFDSWLSAEGKFEAGYRYFENLASELVKITDIGEPTILDIATHMDEQTNKAEEVADIEMLPAVTYHKLDDPRDDLYDEEKNETEWERKQPAAFKKIIAQIKAANLTTLKGIGKSLFNDKTFNKTQTTVIWDAYNRRKKALTPALTNLALKALERMTDPKVNLAKVAAWLHGAGKKVLTVHDQSVLWATWKKLKAQKAPKQASLN